MAFNGQINRAGRSVGNPGIGVFPRSSTPPTPSPSWPYPKDYPWGGWWQQQANLTIQPTGIGSAEAFGAATVQLTIQPTAIASAEAFGTATVQLQILPTGIGSGEAFGTATLQLEILPSGITSSEAFGLPTIGAAPTIPSGGPPFVRVETRRRQGRITRIAEPKLQPIGTRGVLSAEAFGRATLESLLFLDAISSSEALGIPIVIAGEAPEARRKRRREELELLVLAGV